VGLILLWPLDIPPSYSEGLQHCSFPNLRALNLQMELTPSVLTFIRRNNLRIRDLRISSAASVIPMSPLCTFPELSFYRGDCKLIPAFLPGSPVQRVSTTMFPRYDVECILSALSKTTAPLEKVRIHIQNWDFRIFESLGRHTPHILDIEFKTLRELASTMVAVRQLCVFIIKLLIPIFRQSSQVSWPT
jgi:hypothetical protein